VVLAPGGKLSQVVSFTVANGKIAQIDIIANRDRLKQLDLSLLDE
jgi:RNA polymerase sigma-70 factor (ECF subfamily)